jgi:hypothetical protein
MVAVSEFNNDRSFAGSIATFKGKRSGLPINLEATRQVFPLRGPAPTGSVTPPVQNN